MHFNEIIGILWFVENIKMDFNGFVIFLATVILLCCGFEMSRGKVFYALCVQWLIGWTKNLSFLLRLF